MASMAGSASRKARVSDPVTSHMAALQSLPRRGTQRARILEAITATPEGLTYDDVSSETGIVAVSASTRMSELKQAGLIVQQGDRRTSSGGLASVWVARSLDEAGDASGVSPMAPASSSEPSSRPRPLEPPRASGGPRPLTARSIAQEGDGAVEADARASSLSEDQVLAMLAQGGFEEQLELEVA